MTGMYNVLERLRAGEPLGGKEKTIHEQGLVSVLKQIHDDLDAAVFDAYGWHAPLSDGEILERRVALNSARAAEEQQGLIRWLGPEFQNPAAAKQQTLALPQPDNAETEIVTTPSRAGKGKSTTKASKRDGIAGSPGGTTKPAAKTLWPKSLPGQIQVVRQLLIAATQPTTATELAKQFVRCNAERIEEVLESLVITGNARRLPGQKCVNA